VWLHPGLKQRVTVLYADVNDVQMEYEVHGTGDPVVVIAGSIMAIAMMEPLMSALAPSR
jgi:hypothetical protein